MGLMASAWLLVAVLKPSSEETRAGMSAESTQTPHPGPVITSYAGQGHNALDPPLET
jgi:hypothetical protein